MSILRRALYVACVILLFQVLPVSTANSAPVKESLAQLEVQRGIVAVVGLPEGNAAALVDSLNGNEITLWFQSNDEAEVAAVRAAADKAGLLGSRLYAAHRVACDDPTGRQPGGRHHRRRFGRQRRKGR